MEIQNIRLTSVEVTGYKGFENKAVIDIGDLTLVYGENSAGKSSIMRLLVSIAQAVRVKSRYPLLPITVDHSDKNFSSIFTNTQSTPLKLHLTFEDELKKSRLNVGYSIQYIRASNSALVTDFYINSSAWNEWSFEIDTDYVASEKLERKYFGTFNKNKIDANIKFEFNGLVPKFFESKGVSNEDFKHLSGAINRVDKALNIFAESVVWIGPLRHIPARHSILTCLPDVVSSDGKESLQFLHPSNPGGKGIAIKSSSWFEKATERSLSVSLSVENNTEVFSISLAPLEAPAMVIPISEHGAGMSQVLPIVILCAASASDELKWDRPLLFIFENPELHLHDAIHQNLADLFLDSIKKKNVRIIAETHSENVLLATQITELERSDDALSNIFINWVRKGNGGFSEIDRFQFDRAGSLGGLWSKSIFGYTSALARRVMSLKMQKNGRAGA